MSPQKRLDEAVNAFDRRFNGRDGLAAPQCQTGDFYEVLDSSGFTREGDERRTYPSAEEAVEAFIRQLRIYGSEPWPSDDEMVVGVLYWRSRPRIESSRGRWWVRSRFVITPHPEERALLEDEGWPSRS